MIQEKIHRTLKNYFDALSRLDIDSCVLQFAPDAIHNDPVIAPVLTGRDAIKKFFDGITGSFKELNIRNEEIFISGRYAAVKWLAKGRSKKGKKIEFSGIDIMEFNDHGQIASLKGYWDPAPMMKKLQV